MDRRDFLQRASLALAAFGLPALPACAAAERPVGLRRIGQFGACQASQFGQRDRSEVFEKSGVGHGGNPRSTRL